MKYFKYFSFIILTLAVFLFSGCKKDFLDLKPIAKGSTETFYNTLDAIEATCVAAYGELCAREVFDKDYYLTIGSIPSDDVECGGETAADYPAAQHYDQFTYELSDAGPIEEVYRYCYKGIRMANSALDQLKLKKDEIDSKSLKTPQDIADLTFISQRTGEMKFLRAWYHFTLVQVFGGVPLAKKTIQPADFFEPRNTIKEVYDFIDQDLTEAIPLLAEKGVYDVGHATKGAAQALLARALLYESSYAKYYPTFVDDRFVGCKERWQEALNAAEAVIKSLKYSLVGINGERYHSWRVGGDALPATIDGYRHLFTVSGDNSSEGIFEIQNVNDDLGYGVTRGNVMTVYQTVRWYTGGGGARVAAGGWSFNCPTDRLVAAFGNSDPRESNLHSTPGIETDDPRFATTVGREGDSMYVHNVLRGMNFSNLPTKMIGRKFECSYQEYWRSTFTQGPFNVRLIRLAEVYLIAAEAALMVNDPGKALEYINVVRTRARMCGTTGKPENLTACSFEDIVHERRLELTCEPHRFFDLVRWNLTDKFINGMNVLTLGPTFHVDFVHGKYEFWPLPLSEVNLSKGALVQYEQWQ